MMIAGTYPLRSSTQRASAPRHIWRFLACLLLLAAAGPSPSPAQTSPHGTISVPCEQCHSASSWKELLSPPKFDHAATRFPLTGQHLLVRCRACHSSLKFGGVSLRCADCHTDVHRGELGTLCDRCHSPQSWLVPDMIQRHARTRFALVGAHANANCQLCHTNQQKYQYVGVRTDCLGCHTADYQATTNPNHRAAGFSTDCASCHSVTSLRWETSFDHAQTRFALTGAHRATPCIQCHPGGRFQGTPAPCIGCHQTDFAATANPKHTGFPTDCASCHATAAWRPASFDHGRANFRLLGAHQTVPCASCHKSGVYAGTPSACGNAACHLPDYNASANPSHASAGFPLECATCHSTTAWRPSTYNHDSYFPIGAGSRHAPGRWTACADCHNVPTNFRAFTCIDCHQHSNKATVDGQHRGRANYTYTPTSCYTCHPRGN